jgi:hypothetical protein
MINDVTLWVCDQCDTRPSTFCHECFGCGEIMKPVTFTRHKSNADEENMQCQIVQSDCRCQNQASNSLIMQLEDGENKAIAVCNDCYQRILSGKKGSTAEQFSAFMKNYVSTIMAEARKNRKKKVV